MFLIVCSYDQTRTGTLFGAAATFHNGGMLSTEWNAAAERWADHDAAGQLAAIPGHVASFLYNARGQVVSAAERSMIGKWWALQGSNL